MSKLAHSNQETMNKIESQSCKYQDIEDIVVAVIDSNVETVTFKETVGHCAREIIAAIYTHSETDAQSVPVEPKVCKLGCTVNCGSCGYPPGDGNSLPETLACEYDNEDSVVARPDYDTLRAYAVQMKAENEKWQERVFEFDTCIQEVADKLGACCGGVDGDQTDPLSTTQVLLKAICHIKQRAEKADALAERFRKDAELLNYWAENAAGEFLYDATDHDFIKFIPKKAPRPADLVKSAIDSARTE